MSERATTDPVARRRRRLRTGFVIGAAAVIGAGVLQRPVAGDAAGPDPSWFSYSRPQQYSAVTSTVDVPMRDGQSLFCYLTQPGDSTAGQAGGNVVSGKFPGIVDNYYGYTTLTTAGPVAQSYFAYYGYNVITCYDRGQGLSQVTAPGDLYISEANAQEAQDNYDLVEWLAAQPFSDGRIGQTGGSYGAMTSDRVAGLHPPHLLAVAPVSPTASQYLDSRYRGGAFQTAGPSWAAADFGLCACVAPALIAADYEQHPLYDAFWQQIDPQFQNITIPDLEMGGFGDTDLTDGGFESYVSLQKLHNYSGSGGPYLVQGGWGHAGTPSEGNGFLLAWFDHWLYQLPSAPLPPSRVEVDQQTVGGDNVWQNFNAWPPPATHDVNIALNQGGALSLKPGAPGSETYKVGPTDNETAGTAAASSTQSLTFTSNTLTQSTQIAGLPVTHLAASLTTTDGIFVVQLQDVAPDGTVTNATAMPWFLKASHIASHQYLTTIMPNQVYHYSITGWNIDWLFQSGHRIQVTIQSGNSNLAETAPSGDVNVVTGSGGSYVSLPATGTFGLNAPAGAQRTAASQQHASSNGNASSRSATAATHRANASRVSPSNVSAKVQGGDLHVPSLASGAAIAGVIMMIAIALGRWRSLLRRQKQT